MSNDTLPQLSEREREILRLVATGATNQQIAAQLNISANTVKVHLRNIFGKIGVASRTEATMYAVRNGLLDIDIEKEPSLVASSPPASQSDTSQETTSEQAVAANGISTSFSSPEPTRDIRHSLPGALLRGGVVGFIIIVAILATFIAIERNNRPEPTSIVQPSGIAPPPIESRWRLLAPLPSPQAGFALVTYSYEGRQYLYAIGGETPAGVSNAVLRFDIQTNTWVRLSSKPVAVTDVHAVVVGDRLYVPGGRTASGTISNQLDVYEPRRDRWITLAPLPAPRSGYALATVEGKIYLFGGWDGQSYRADVWQYNPDNDTWTERTPLTKPRAFAGVATVEERIYIIGGEDESGPLTLNEIYTASGDIQQSDPWSTRSPLPEARRHLAAVAASGFIFVVGGSDIESSALIYNVNLDAWEPLLLPVSPRLRDARVQALNNYIYITGGSNQNGAVDHVYAYQAFYSVFLPLVPND